ncbi:hypothetical protein ACFPTO_24490 [Paraburkholderia denitrificans]|uniref:MFS transporter n=1 Tax=Paraburkholderia denitrificans TaxID=694025 RepID=A0ABW0JFE0_9BURK
MNALVSASSAGYELVALRLAAGLAGGVIGVHLGLHSVFFVTAALLVACAGLAQWARGRQPLPATSGPLFEEKDK